MKRNLHQSRLVSHVLSFVLLISFLTTSSAFASPLADPQAPTITNSVYLPFVYRASNASVQPPVRNTIFGVETSWIDTTLISKAVGVNASWWRYFAFNWKAIEPNDVSPGQYNWGAVNEQDLIEAASNGISIVATVKYTPYWAQAYRDSNSVQCSPIKDTTSAIADFREFITALVNRYKQPPYNVKIWQFWNEPDVPPEALINIGELYTSPFGCWGVLNDPYYGGEKYGKFLSIFSQAVKAADPQAKTTNGGMLLDCNPDESTTCTQGKFFEGTLRGLQANNGLPYLDYVSFHVYGSWYGDLSLDEGWQGFKNGGVMVGKANFLRNKMLTYGIDPPKPLIMTEAGLMCRREDQYPLPSNKKCSDATPPPEFSDDQADYVVWIYVRAIAEDISGVMWYMLNYQSYRHVGLMNADGSPKPGYLAYQNLVAMLGEAQYIGKLDQYYPTLRAFEFTKNSDRIWVIWAPDQVDHIIDLPAGFQAAYDKLGNPISLQPGATTITINSPVYLILYP